MNVNLEIISGKSVAGICIGENVSNHLNDFYKDNLDVEFNTYSNKTGVFNSYRVAKGLLTIYTLESGEIISIGCNQNYKGKYNGVLTTGMSVEDIIKNSTKQMILHGGLIVNNDFGLYFILPSPYDEIADTISHLPKEVKLDNIHVENIEWWIKPELTPNYAK